MEEVEEKEEKEKEAPTFILKPEPVVSVEGEAAKFYCRVTGFPRPRLTWVVNGSPVVHGSQFKLTYDGMHILEILRTKDLHSGKVEVFAKNIVGEAQCFTTLEVRPKHDDYRVVLKNSPRRKHFLFFIHMIFCHECIKTRLKFIKFFF